MGRIDVSPDVGFDRGIDGNDAQTTHHFRVVGYLLRTEQNALFEEIQILINVLQNWWGKGQ